MGPHIGVEDEKYQHVIAVFRIDDSVLETVIKICLMALRLRGGSYRTLKGDSGQP